MESQGKREIHIDSLPFESNDFVEAALKCQCKGNLIDVPFDNAILTLTVALQLWAKNYLKKNKYIPKQNKVVLKDIVSIAADSVQRKELAHLLYEGWFDSLFPEVSDQIVPHVQERTRGNLLSVMDADYTNFTRIFGSLRLGSQNYKLRRWSPDGAEQQKNYVKEKFMKPLLELYVTQQSQMSVTLQDEYRDVTVAAKSMLESNTKGEVGESMLDSVSSKIGILLTELEDLYDVDSYFSQTISAYPILQLIRFTLYRAKSDDVHYARVIWYVLGQLLHEVSVNYCTEKEFMRHMLEEGVLKDSAMIAQYVGEDGARVYHENVLLAGCAYEGEDKKRYIAKEVDILLEDIDWVSPEEHSIFFHLRTLFTHMPLDIKGYESLQDIDDIVARHLDHVWAVFGAVVRFAIEHKKNIGPQSNMLVKYMELIRVINKMLEAKEALSNEVIQIEFEIMLATKMIVDNDDVGRETDEQKTNVNFSIGLANKHHEGKLNELSEGEVSSTQKFMEILLTSAIIEYFKKKTIKEQEQDTRSPLPSTVHQ